MIFFREAARTGLTLDESTYVYCVQAVGADRLAVICSDDSLRIIDAASLQPVDGQTVGHAHAGITCLVGVQDVSTPYWTAGRDGYLRGWDGRTGKRCFKIESGGSRLM